MLKFKKFLKWFLIVVVGAYVLLVLYRAVVLFQEDKTKAAVEKIHNTKLTMSDVLGTKLPPEPTAEAARATVQGIDANGNGIRDDVELAIFKEYPNSAKTRAVLLQYALALQLEMVQEIVNTETVIAVAQEKSRAAVCISDVVSKSDIQKFIDTTREYTDFVKEKQINTEVRDIAQKDFYKKIGSYSDIETTCDIDLSLLSN